MSWKRVATKAQRKKRLGRKKHHENFKVWRAGKTSKDWPPVTGWGSNTGTTWSEG